MDADDPFAPPTSAVFEEGELSAEARIRRVYIRHEQRLRSIGAAFYILVGVIGVPTALVFVSAVAERRPEPVAVMGAVLAFLVAAAWSGRQLRTLEARGRLPAIGFSLLLVLFVPVGTLLSPWFVFLLLSSKTRFVLSAEYRRIVRDTPEVVAQSPWRLAALLVVLLASVGVLMMRYLKRMG